MDEFIRADARQTTPRQSMQEAWPVTGLFRRGVGHDLFAGRMVTRRRCQLPVLSLRADVPLPASDWLSASRHAPRISTRVRDRCLLEAPRTRYFQVRLVAAGQERAGDGTWRRRPDASLARPRYHAGGGTARAFRHQRSVRHLAFARSPTRHAALNRRIMEEAVPQVAYAGGLPCQAPGPARPDPWEARHAHVG